MPSPAAFRRPWSVVPQFEFFGINLLRSELARSASISYSSAIQSIRRLDLGLRIALP